MSELEVHSLADLRTEPKRLQEQGDLIATELRSLVLDNYHVFIQSSQCSSIVQNDLRELKQSAQDIRNSLPTLKEHCADFETTAKTAVKKQNDIQHVFDHYLQLSELLEMPHLLESCIRQEMFESALDMVQFVKEMLEDPSSSQSSNVALQLLVKEIAQLKLVLREKLLEKLREDIDLSSCVRAVGYLRRLDQYTPLHSADSPDYEEKLKEEFLFCRNNWLNSLTRSIPITDAYQHITQVIDVKRTSWFDLVTQYSAIFGSETLDGKVDPPLCRWATSTVADFIQILIKQLPKIDDFSSLATILEQSLYFGSSLGRVGVDFRAVLSVYFEDHVSGLMAQSWRRAALEFKDKLQAHAPDNSSSNRVAIYTPHQDSSSAHTDEYAPPRVLLTTPLLADFTNAVLMSLNELRLCTITSLRSRLSAELHNSFMMLLQTTADFMDQNGLQEKNERHQELQEHLSCMIQTMLEDMIPYLVKSFHRLYPEPKRTHGSYVSSKLHRATFVHAAQELGLRETDKDT